MERAPTPLLRIRGVSKDFPGVRALDSVDLDLDAAQVHAVVGENGAGKSTLMKILAGAYRPDSGSLEIAGRPYVPADPRDAMRHGVSLIYQEQELIPHLSIGENVLLGRLPRRGPLVDWVRARRRAAELLAAVGLELDPAASIGPLGAAQKQLIEIARALSIEARIIVMDEPTASLSGREIDRLFAIIRDLKARGVAFLYVSHRLEELEQIADVVTVLRDGSVVHHGPLRALPLDQLIRHIVGRRIETYFPARKATIGEPVLRVVGLHRIGVLHDISLEVRAGEVLGVAGLVGSGRTELARAIFGADRFDGGQVTVLGRPVRPGRPDAAAHAGLALIPEERKTEGLVLDLSVVDNIALPSLKRLSRWGLFDWRAARAESRQRVDGLRIRTPSLDTRVESLSGGNQQKVVIAKWLAGQPRVLIFDEPTKGIDIGAKVEVYRAINELAEAGVAIVLISSEMPEVLAMSDRIMVMRQGRIAGFVNAREATQDRLFALAVGHGEADVA
ncbi:MAG: sugar ABC transporter ATP-binding protein [Chloroflexota bacterium]|nr:sugar ABC transporter ATP-binding protein [Chloroflexota bacterium]